MKSPTMLIPKALVLDLSILLPHTDVLKDTLSMEILPGLVRVMGTGMVMLQLVKVSLHAMDAHACIELYGFPYPVVVVCPVLTLGNGVIMYGNESRRVGTSATLSCNMGYRLAGEPVITCQLSDSNMATWSQSSSTCEGVFKESIICFIISVPMHRDNLLGFAYTG